MVKLFHVRAAPALVVLLLAVAGCDEGSSLAVQIADYTFDKSDEIRVTLFEDDRIRVFERSDFAPIPLRASSDVGPFAVASDGTATVRVELRKGDTRLALGEVNVMLREETNWRVRVFRAVQDPRSLCADCENSVRFDIAPAFQRDPGEALWVVW